jgi:hypothetical protein
MYTGHLEKPTSKKEITDKIKEKNKQVQVIKAVPLGDRNLPKHKDKKNPIKGRKTKVKYIINLLIN